MKRKIRVDLLLGISALTIGMTIPALAAEFTDVGTQVLEAATEEEVFDAGESAGVEFETGEDSGNGTEEFVAEDEASKTVTLDGIRYEYIPETDTYRVVKAINTEDVTITGKILGKPVSEIGEGAFADCNQLETFELEEWEVAPIIRARAFENCVNLKKVAVPCGITVEGDAFKNCPRLSKFSADRGWSLEKKNSFAENAFDIDTKVVVYFYVNIDSETEELFNRLGIFYIFTDEPFYEWNEPVNGMNIVREDVGAEEKRTYIADFDNSVKVVKVCDKANYDYDITIYRKAFYGCSNVQEIQMGDKVTAIETKAFSHCTNLERVFMTENVTKIAADAFEECPKAVIYAPKGSYALAYAKKHGIAYKVSGTDKMPRPALSYVKSSKDANVITLKWNHIPYADGYQIYRFNSDTKKYERMKTIKDSERLYYKTSLRGGITEYFKVRAYSDAKIYSEKYSPLSMKVTAEAIPERAEIRNVVAKSANKLGIYWKAKAGDGYLLYRSEKEPYKGYKKIKYITDSSVNRYGDKGVKKGKTYYYRMRAYRYIDGKRVYGPLSEPCKAKWE